MSIEKALTEDLKEQIQKAVDEVVNNSPDADITVYGIEEVVNKIKDCLPSYVSAQIVPADYLPQGSENKAYIIPIDRIQPLEPEFNFVIR